MFLEYYKQSSQLDKIFNDFISKILFSCIVFNSMSTNIGLGFYY